MKMKLEDRQVNHLLFSREQSWLRYDVDYDGRVVWVDSCGISGTPELGEEELKMLAAWIAAIDFDQ